MQSHSLSGRLHHAAALLIALLSSLQTDRLTDTSERIQPRDDKLCAEMCLHHHYRANYRTRLAESTALFHHLALAAGQRG